MKKQDAINQLIEHEDAIINFRSQNSGKLKYNVCTLNFEVDYIKNKKNRVTETEDTLLVFCWDTDSYRLLRPTNITSIIPLANILRNH